MSGNKLKWIAMLIMMIDHIGYGLLGPIISAHPESYGTVDNLRLTPLVIVYYAMRLVGRIAFPIFIFLLIQGFLYSHDRIQYFARLLLFAVISEIPFDLVFSISTKQLNKGKIIEFAYQNVFFTLAFGLLLITIIDVFRKIPQKGSASYVVVGTLCIIILLVVYGLQPDYGVIGALAILAAYCFKNDPKKMTAACVTVLLLSSQMEITAYLAIVLVGQYNGSRGKGNKWVFYLFYPIHLLMIVGIRILIGY
ncbi:MAG: TraX family protein [Lachnospiraceae bacterium]|nr:TraX family protein [Lachnospiraceae bacterium]